MMSFVQNTTPKLVTHTGPVADLPCGLYRNTISPDLYMLVVEGDGGRVGILSWESGDHCPYAVKMLADPYTPVNGTITFTA